MDKLRTNLNNLHHQLIIGALANMITQDGLTFHEAMEVLEDIKRQTFPALMQMSREKEVG